jgi:hypothetical protein
MNLSRSKCGLDVDMEYLKRQLREGLDALGPAPRAELLHILMLPDLQRAERIGEFWSYHRAAPSPSPDRLQGGPDGTGRRKGVPELAPVT